MFSHVTSGLGALLPACELCALARSRGALAIVDGAQAVGQIQVDVQALGCDANVGSPHKWILAPKGTGFLYLRREVQDRFWTTLASNYQWDNHEDGAFRFAVRHRQRSGRGRADGGAAFHRDSRHAADRALGREPHQAA